MDGGIVEQDASNDATVEVFRARTPGSWMLELGSPSGGSARVLRVGERLVLGSGREADLRVEDETVSHRHCALRVEADRVEIQDLSSKNGVYTGALRVHRASILGTGSFVIGRTGVIVRAGIEEEVPPNDSLPGTVAGSLGMRRVIAEIRRHARTRAPVLLQGESGTGKDVLARSLHDLGRRGGPYVPLNVGALPESLADAELFGHRRGAFTGAVQSRTGAFEQAHTGTLFLDEIADLPPPIQVKLLRVVEDGAVRPLGSSSVLRVDVRIVSASWALLEEKVQNGSFRADLYHRLSTVVVQIPPLRHRKSDIAELSLALLRRIRDEVGKKTLTSSALSRLMEHDWPGNVRELSSVLYRAAMASSTSEIQAEHVLLGSTKLLPRLCALGPSDARGLLQEHHGNVSAAARAAGVARSTFRSWLSRSSEPQQATATSGGEDRLHQATS